jgi:hypothetical protein
VPTLLPSVDSAVAWMMRKNPAERPPTLFEAVIALDPSRGNKPSVPPPTGFSAGKPGYTPTLAPLPSSIGAPKRRWPLALGAVALVVAAGTLAWWLVGRNTEALPEPGATTAPSTPSTPPAAATKMGSAEVKAVVKPAAAAPPDAPVKPRDRGSQAAPAETAPAQGSSDIIHLEDSTFGSGK